MSADRQGTDATTIRRQVSEAYGKMVTRRRGGCCEGASCGSRAPGSDVIGYTKEDVRSVPEGADVPTFGCGNPLAFSEVQEGQTVLDLGSGAGLDLLIAAAKVGPAGRVIGVDMTDEMIDKARANVRAAGHANVDVRRGLIEELPVESGTVDWVISNCVINLSPEKERVFAEIARVLRPGGRMLISDIVVEDLPEWVRQSVAALSGCVAGAISEGEYVAGLGEAGLVDVEVRGRHQYTSAEIGVFIADSDELSKGLAADAHCARNEAQERFSEALGGRVASISVSARKPGVPA
jgi:arsenite methyltransferase